MNDTWPKQEPKNIIVRMPSWLGDLVMATPILHDLRNRYPTARITAMCQTNTAPLLQHNPNIDEIYSYSKPTGWIPRWHHTTVIKALQLGKYDLGVILAHSFSARWWFWRGQVANRLGFRGTFSDWMIFSNILLNRTVPFPSNKESQHLVQTYKSLLEPLGIPISDSSPMLYLSPAELESAHQLLNSFGFSPEKNIIVGINPGAAYGSAKCWEPDRFRGVTERLLQDPRVAILYFGDNNGASLVNEICHGIGDKVINLAGKTTIRELMALIKLCSVFLTNDSGPMHITAALKVPLVALFGSTSDVKTGPYGSGIVINKHVQCAPCYKRICPIDFRCMKRIEVEEVYQALLKQIGKNKLPG